MTPRVQPQGRRNKRSNRQRVVDLARTLTQAEIPIGIVTALLGAPLFTFLLVQSRRRSTAR